MYLQMDPLDNPLNAYQIQTGREISIELFPNGQFWFIDDPDHLFGTSVFPTGIWTWSDRPEQLLTLYQCIKNECQQFSA